MMFGAWGGLTNIVGIEDIGQPALSWCQPSPPLFFAVSTGCNEVFSPIKPGFWRTAVNSLSILDGVARSNNRL